MMMDGAAPEHRHDCGSGSRRKHLRCVVRGSRAWGVTGEGLGLLLGQAEYSLSPDVLEELASRMLGCLERRQSLVPNAREE